MGNIDTKERAEEAGLELFPSSMMEMLDWKFSKVEPVVEYTQGDVEAERMKKWKIRFQGLAFEIDNSMKLLKYVLSMKFALRNEIEALNCIITSDPTVFDGVFLGEKFPKVLDETTFESGGVIEIPFKKSEDQTIQFDYEFYLPKYAGATQIFAVVIDENNVSIAKAKCDILLNDSFGVSRAATAKKERIRRLEGLGLMNELLGQDFQKLLKTGASMSRAKTQFIEGYDGTKLALRSYQAHSFCQAVLVLTAATSVIFDPLADQISRMFPIIVKIVEVRGHGESSGKRGYSATKTCLWKDIKTFLHHFRFNHPELPIFLGGHYTEAGMMLNYSSWPQRDPADGYLFISPDFAPEFANTQVVNQFRADLKTKYNWGSIFFNKVTRGFLSGESAAYELEYPEIIYKFVPNLVDSVSINNTQACRPKHAIQQLKDLKGPYGVWIGEKDEFLYSTKLLDAIKHIAREDCMFDMILGATHYGILQEELGNKIGQWILQTSTSKLFLASHHAHLDTSPSIELLKEHFERSSLHLNTEVYNEIVDLKLHLKKNNFLVANDGARVAYNVFLPKSQKTGICFIFLGGLEKSITCHHLCEKYNLVVLNFVGRIDEDLAKISNKETIWGDIRSLIRHAKFNYPNYLILLGGHGTDASLALGYSHWKQKEEVNGYALISPILNIETIYESDKQFFRGTREQYFSILGHDRPTWFNPDSSTEDSNFLNDPYTRAMWDATYPTTFLECLKNLTVPFSLYIGQEEIMEMELLHEKTQRFAATIPLSNVEIVPQTSHLAMLMSCSTMLGPWISRFVQLLTPANLKLLNTINLSHFKHIQLLGKGAYGKVDLVQHISSKKYLAMKTLKKADIVRAGDREVQYAISERNLLRDVNSSWVVSYIGSFQTDTLLCILMEYVIGGELFTYLRLEGKFSEERARFYAAEVVLFFEYIHEREIVYRDLKPENILLDSMGHIKITDMGFAKKLQKDKTNSFCGTIDYLSPEVLEKKDYGITCDYWALGVLIYEMICGYTPFTASSKNSIIRKILYQEVEFEDFVSPHARDLMLRLLRKNPKKRLGAEGIEEIKNHRFFRGVMWESLQNREISAPFVPRFSHEGDTSNFLVVQEPEESSKDNGFTFDNNLFADF